MLVCCVVGLLVCWFVGLAVELLFCRLGCLFVCLLAWLFLFVGLRLC